MPLDSITTKKTGYRTTVTRAPRGVAKDIAIFWRVLGEISFLTYATLLLASGFPASLSQKKITFYAILQK